ncbi:MAG: CBS domain-containing protein [Gammaproteobacteria bacterium]
MKRNLVRHWMTANVLSVPSATPLVEAEVFMEAHRIRRLLVVDDGRLAGVVTSGDLRQAKAGRNPESAAQPRSVGEIMTPDPISVPEAFNIGLAAQTMLQAKISGLPVVDDQGGLVGILSESDIFRYVIEVSR